MSPHAVVLQGAPAWLWLLIVTLVAPLHAHAAAGQSTNAQAVGDALSILRVVADTTAGTLTIDGAHFASRPFVTLDLVPLAVQSVGPTRVVVTAPLDMMPAGRYLLTVSRGGAPGESASVRVPLGAATDGVEPAIAAPRGDTPAVPASKRSASPSVGAEPVDGIPAGSAVAARVGDRVISVEEVDREWLRTDPASYLAAKRRLHEARRRAAHELVTTALLQREAAEQGLSVEALLARELPKRTIPMPDSAVTSLYQALGERTRGATLEQMRPALRAWLEQITEPELAKMSYAEELMKVSTRADIVLSPPAIRIERSQQDATLGADAAVVEIVAFGDLQSVDYARFAQALPRVRETFGNRLRIVFKHLPLQGPISVGAAQAAHCANRQGKFWPFHDAVLAQPAFLDTARLKQFAAAAGLETSQFNDCVDRDESRGVISQALEEAARYDVRTVPSFLVNGVLAPAPPPFLPPFEYFQRLIEEELARRAKPPGR